MTIGEIHYMRNKLLLVTRRKLLLPIKITFIVIAIVFILCQVTLASEKNFVGASFVDDRTLPNFNIGAVGDWGCSRITNHTVNNILDKQPELVLGLGDYSYKDRADCWLHMVAPLDHKMKIAIGNHDHLLYIGNTTTVPAPLLLKQYMDHFNLTKQFYSFNYHNIHFVAMSTQIPIWKGFGTI